MIPLIVLISTYAIARVWLRRRDDRALPGRIALAMMLLTTAAAHFASTEELAAMVPPPLPAAEALVYATGLAELAFALLLVVRPSRGLGVVLALFFVSLLPANVYSAVAGVGMGAHGTSYLWFRVPLQVLFIAWALLCTGALRPRRGRWWPAFRSTPNDAEAAHGA